MPYDGSEFKFDETTQVLIEARCRIAEDWWDGSAPFHGHCAVWAISRQRGVNAMIFPALEHLERAIYGYNSEPCLRVRSWNDEPGRTKEEVLAVYDAAIVASLSASASDRA